MWDTLIGRLPERLVFICTVLAFVVPYVAHKANTMLHEYGDPPWKKADRNEQKKKSNKKS